MCFVFHKWLLCAHNMLLDVGSLTLFPYTLYVECVALEIFGWCVNAFKIFSGHCFDGNSFINHVTVDRSSIWMRFFLHIFAGDAYAFNISRGWACITAIQLVRKREEERQTLEQIETFCMFCSTFGICIRIMYMMCKRFTIYYGQRLLSRHSLWKSRRRRFNCNTYANATAIANDLQINIKIKQTPILRDVDRWLID